MLANYSQQSSFEQAIIETFGGNRPCEICKFIQAVDEEDTTPTPEQKSGDSQRFKLMPTRAPDICILPGFSRVLYPPVSKLFYPSLYSKVPTPPPRLV